MASACGAHSTTARNPSSGRGMRPIGKKRFNDDTYKISNLLLSIRRNAEVKKYKKDRKFFVPSPLITSNVCFLPKNPTLRRSTQFLAPAFAAGLAMDAYYGLGF